MNLPTTPHTATAAASPPPNLVFGPRHYVPILKGKRGEYTALEKIQTVDEDLFTPLIEIPFISQHASEANQNVKKHLDKHAGTAKKPGYIPKAWGTRRRLMLDLGLMDPAARAPGGIHPVEYLGNQLAGLGVLAVPVFGFERNQDFWNAVKSRVQADNLGVCFRLSASAGSIPPPPKAEFDRALTFLGLKPADCDIVLDFEAILPKNAGSIALAAIGAINTLPYVQNWRTLTVAATAFPENMTAAKISANSKATRSREEWTMWKTLLASSPTREPAFGDYAIAHPDIPDIDPKLMFSMMSANIRYTTDDEWLIVRGTQVQKAGNRQYRTLAQNLVADHHFKGRAFSWGDQYVDDCARGNASPGSAEKWRSVGTNHHVTLVSRQVANHP